MQKLANTPWESCELSHEMMYEHGRFLEPEEEGKADFVETVSIAVLGEMFAVKSRVREFTLQEDVLGGYVIMVETGGM